MIAESDQDPCAGRQRPAPGGSRRRPRSGRPCGYLSARRPVGRRVHGASSRERPGPARPRKSGRTPAAQRRWQNIRDNALTLHSLPPHAGCPSAQESDACLGNSRPARCERPARSHSTRASPRRGRPAARGPDYGTGVCNPCSLDQGIFLGAILGRGVSGLSRVFIDGLGSEAERPPHFRWSSAKCTVLGTFCKARACQTEEGAGPNDRRARRSWVRGQVLLVA